MRRVRGISEAVAVVLLMIVAIAIVATIWFFSQRFVGGGDVATARAVLTQNTFVGANQVVTVSLRIDSKSDAPLFIREIRVISDRGGSLGTAAVAIGTVPSISPITPTATAGGISFGFSGENVIRPRQTSEIAITMNFGTSYATTLQFVVVLFDPSGRTYTVTTNEIKL